MFLKTDSTSKIKQEYSGKAVSSVLSNLDFLETGLRSLNSKCIFVAHQFIVSCLNLAIKSTVPLKIISSPHFLTSCQPF